MTHNKRIAKCKLCPKEFETTLKIFGHGGNGGTTQQIRTSEEGIYFQYNASSSGGCWFCKECWKIVSKPIIDKIEREKLDGHA